MKILNNYDRAWIISLREDLIWFQGSVLAGVVLLLLFVLISPADETSYTLSYPVIMAVFLWGAIFDGTHVWGTYARSYLAPDKESRSGLPQFWSLLLFAVGPTVAFADSKNPLTIPLFGIFLLAAYLWAYWHLVRQHYGFMMLYRKRAGEIDSRGALLDTGILWVGCLYPFLRFSLSEAYLHTELPQLVPVLWMDSLRLALDIAFGVTILLAAALVISERFEPLRLGPKHLLLVIVITFHILVFSLLDHLLTILAALTIYHNLQYHRIVWQYEAGFGRQPSGGLRPYLFAGLMLGILWYGIRVLVVDSMNQELMRNVLVGLCWGVAFHHYLVDGRIWRVRRSKVVARALEAGANYKTDSVAPQKKRYELDQQGM
jgi:hypothetical protein